MSYAALVGGLANTPDSGQPVGEACNAIVHYFGPSNLPGGLGPGTSEVIPVSAKQKFTTFAKVRLQQ